MNKKYRYTKKHYEIFKLALELSITAPTEKQSNECIEIAICIATMFPQDIIEKAKREVEFYINNQPQKKRARRVTNSPSSKWL